MAKKKKVKSENQEIFPFFQAESCPREAIIDIIKEIFFINDSIIEMLAYFGHPSVQSWPPGVSTP